MEKSVGTQDRNSSQWLTVAQAAERAGVSQDSIRRAYYAGHLRSTTIGDGIKSRRRILAEWVDQWLESRATGGEQ